MKKVVSVLLTAVMLCAYFLPAEASSYTLKGFLTAYKSGDFSKAYKIAKKLPKKAKSYNSKMTSKMKAVFLNKILSVNKYYCYYLADITGDKKPELFLITGACEVSFCHVYKYSKGKLIKLGKVRSRHSEFGDYPGKKAFIKRCCGSAFSKITYSKGRIKEKLLNTGNNITIRLPYMLKAYHNLSPFSMKNTKTVKKARLNINKLIKRVNPVIIKLYPKTRRIKLNAKNKTILATVSAERNNGNAHIGNGLYSYRSGNKTYGLIPMKNNYITNECKNLFGVKPAFGKLSKTFKQNTKKSVGNIVIRNKGVVYCDIRCCGSPKTAKVACIKKIKGGYRVVVDHYLTDYHLFETPRDMIYAHTMMDVKKNKKSCYKYVIKKINKVVYFKD